MSAPSRVTSVAELRRLGVKIPDDPDFEDCCLAEIRPRALNANERADLTSRGVQRFLATVETERQLLQVDVETTKEWFVELMPLRILANVPDNASALIEPSQADPAPLIPALKSDVAHGFATGFLQQWCAGRSPKKKTRAFLTAASFAAPALEPMLKPAIHLLSTPSSQRLTTSQRRMVINALESIIQATQTNREED